MILNLIQKKRIEDEQSEK